jgi:hypothetical protein
MTYSWARGSHTAVLALSKRKANPMKRKTPKPFSEMTRREQIAEAHAAIGRLERDIHTGGWTRNLGDALARWQSTLTRLCVEQCDCEHSWTEHVQTANGAFACRHFGCGCNNVVRP